MTPTPWEIRNRLSAILSTAKYSGKPYVDVESGSLFAELGADKNSKITVCREVMTRMMRTGDLILKETSNGDGSTLLVRYLLDAKHEN